MEIMKPNLEIVMQYEAVVEPPHAPNESINITPVSSGTIKGMGEVRRPIKWILNRSCGRLGADIFLGKDETRCSAILSNRE